MAPPTPILDSVLDAMMSHNPLLVAIAIFSATFIHEDIATVAAGMVVADGLVGAEFALPALYAGILSGDLALYGIGRLIGLHRFSTKLLNRKRLAAFKAWLHGRLMLGVFVVRFLPGLRLSAYVIFGFLAMPIRRFIAADFLATSIWTTGLFYLSFAFGALTTQWLGYWRWPAIVLAIATPILLLQHFLRDDVSFELVKPVDDGDKP
jgi:membrane protein DedA with SNARE-associated domain